MEKVTFLNLLCQCHVTAHLTSHSLFTSLVNLLLLLQTGCGQHDMPIILFVKIMILIWGQWHGWLASQSSCQTYCQITFTVCQLYTMLLPLNLASMKNVRFLSQNAWKCMFLKKKEIGKWPWYKRDNALRGVQYHPIMDSAEAPLRVVQFTPLHRPLLNDIVHLGGWSQLRDVIGPAQCQYGKWTNGQLSVLYGPVVGQF